LTYLIGGSIALANTTKFIQGTIGKHLENKEKMLDIQLKEKELNASKINDSAESERNVEHNGLYGDLCNDCPNLNETVKDTITNISYTIINAENISPHLRTFTTEL